MLSKSQARFFFVSTTLGFSAVFLWLTVDTVSQVPKRSNESKMTEAVVRGKDLWESKNCMGCHTLLGEGGYYAPELTKVVERRGTPWIKTFLKDPQAMFPGQRKMVQYHFSDEQISDIVAFLSWVGEIDANGFPAKPDLAPPAPQGAAAGSVGSSAALDAAPELAKSVCLSCHALAGKGGVVGPSFDGQGTRRSAEWLDTWLKDPQAIKPGTAMPNLHLSDADRAALVTWLSTLQ